MPQVVTTNAIIRCPHDGVGTTTPSHPLWSVNGGTVCVEGDVGVLDCRAPIPCGGYHLESMGLNATYVDGRRVILTTDFNRTITNLPLTVIETHTTLDNSTPVAIPNGQAAPPLPPAVANMVPPTVTVTPSRLLFDTTTMLPSVLEATFTLGHPFPLRWMLTLISEPTGIDLIATEGLPPGLTLTPIGGVWTTPALTVHLSLTAAYAATLGMGKTHFFMTAVSQRGLSSWAKLTVAVS